MVTTEIVKAISGLRTNADRLHPKPSEDFVNAHKAKSKPVLDAAKSFDRTTADEKGGDHKKTHAALLQATNQYFDALLDLAKKEPASINGKLQKYVGVAQKEAVGTTESEYKAFLKAEAAHPTSPEPELLKALKDRADSAERGQKAAKAYRTEAEKALATIKANHKKGGEDALAESQKLLFDLRLSETDAAQDKDYAKGKKPLKQEHEAMLKNARQNEATKLRVAGELAAGKSERIMDEGRDFRVAALKEIHAHQDAVEKAKALAAKDEKNQTTDVKKIQTEFKKLTSDSNLVLEQTSKETWSVIEEMTANDTSKPYNEVVGETREAYRSLPVLNTKLQALDKQVGALRGTVDSEQAAETVASLRNEIMTLRIKFRRAHLAEAEFKKTVAECEVAWQERAKTARRKT